MLELLLGNEPEHRTVEAARKAFEETRAEYEPSARFKALGLSPDASEAFFKDSRELVNGYYRMENPATQKLLASNFALILTLASSNLVASSTDLSTTKKTN